MGYCLTTCYQLAHLQALPKRNRSEFLKVVFGRYGKTMPVKYLPSVRSDAGKADSVLMGMKSIRFAAMEEPDDAC